MAITITVDIDSVAVMAGLEAMPALTVAETEKALVIGTHLIEAEVKALTPRKTGRLFSGWHSSVTGYTGHVTNRVSYAGYIEEGTRPHDIVAHGLGYGHGGALMIPLGARTLSGRARAGSDFIFRKRVHHPGFLGRHMARVAAATAKPAVVQIFRDAIKDAVRLALGK